MSEPPRYRGTRGEAPVSFERALLAGQAPAGGLYLPEHLPRLPAGWQAAGSVSELAEPALAPLMGKENAEAVARALNFEIPLVPLGSGALLELFHGPTVAFKDVGARSLARLMEGALKRTEQRALVLVATSGDTGGAVADAFAGLERVEVALLYPADGVSGVQEEQLTAERAGVRAFAVEGTFDDCQRLVKGAFLDPDLRTLGLTSANSINIGRLLPQMLYYLWGAAQARKEWGSGASIRFVVPSGNLGNLTAGLLAREMGLDGVTFMAAHNRNDYFARYLSSEAREFDFDASVPTLSNAMDVGAPSNFERLYSLFGERLKGAVEHAVVDDASTLARMRRVYEEHGYLACPHTAVGLEAALRAGTLRGSVVLATAHPAKFPEVVKRGVGVEAPAPPTLAAFAEAPKRVERLAAEPAALKEALLIAH